MNQTFINAISELTKKEIKDVVKQLAQHYNFDTEDALQWLEINSKPLSRSDLFGETTDVEEPKVAVEEPKVAVEEPKVAPPDLFGETVLGETTDDEESEATKPKTTKPKATKPKATKPKKTQKPRCPFPWTGHVIEGLCQGIRPNHGMLSQCTQPQKAEGFCGTCFKQFQSNGKPKCGTVADRLKADKDGIDYKNPETGKTSVKMVLIMKKLKMTKDEVIAEAKKFGIEIPDSEFELVKKTKGRPPTVKPSTKDEDLLDKMIAQAISAVSSSSESESDDTENTKTKNKEVTLEPEPEPEPEPETKNTDNVYDVETEDEEEEDVVQVKSFSHNEMEYLIDPANNILYDKKTHDTVGIWDPITETISPYEEVSDDEE